MAIFDTLIDDMAQRFGLGANAGPLVREALTLITGSQGGIGGFLNLFKTAGLATEVESWLGHSNAAPMAAQQIDRVLGASALGGIAKHLGLGQTVVSAALGYAVPKLIGLLTPNGVIPTSLPAEVTNFLSPPAFNRAAETTVQRPAPQTAQVAPRRIDIHPTARDEPALTRWLWPLLAGLAVLGLALFFWPSSRTPDAPSVAMAPTVSPAPAPARLAPPRLAISNDDGVIHYSGVVHDEETRNSIVDALKAAFGTDKVQGDISVDLNRAAAPWLVNFRNAVESLKTPGVQVVFDGNSVNLGGVVGDADRDRIASSLKNVLGGGLVFGTLADKVTDLVSSANAKATTELAALKTGYTASELTAVLNQSIINFPASGAEIPAGMMTFLQNAAGDLKQLPKSSVLEIAGYTDNTGDPAANVKLSQQRADAVRDVLIKAGADPGMLVAKGYGDANPVASNDLLEGRFRNRRIEYHVLKA